jgi:hypothetical protein
MLLTADSSLTPTMGAFGLHMHMKECMPVCVCVHGNAWVPIVRGTVKTQRMSETEYVLGAERDSGRIPPESGRLGLGLYWALFNLHPLL